MSTLSKRAFPTVLLLLFVVLPSATCMRSGGTSGPKIKASLVLRLLPQINPALLNPDEPLNITRAEWDIRAGAAREVLSQDRAEIDPDLPDGLVVTVRLSVDEGDIEPQGHLLLLGDNQRVEWAGLFGPVLMNTRQELWTVPVRMGRGGLVNLSVQTITVSGLENGLAQGMSGTLSALTNGEQGTTVFWASRNSAVATVDAQGRVAGVSAGTVTIVAAAGLVADSVVVQVHPQGS